MVRLGGDGMGWAEQGCVGMGWVRMSWDGIG